MLNPNIANNATIGEIGTLHGVPWGASFHGHINFDDGHEHDDFSLEKVLKIMTLDNTKSQDTNVNASLRYLVDKVF